MPKPRVQVPGLEIPGLSPASAPGGAPALRVPSAAPVNPLGPLTDKLSDLFTELADQRQKRLKSEARAFVASNQGLVDQVLGEIESSDLSPEQLRNARIGALNRLVDAGALRKLDNPFFELELNGSIARAAAHRAVRNTLERMAANGGEALLGPMDEHGIRSGGTPADRLYAEEVARFSEVPLLRMSALARAEFAKIIEDRKDPVLEIAGGIIEAERTDQIKVLSRNEIMASAMALFEGRDDPQAVGAAAQEVDRAVTAMRSAGIKNWRDAMHKALRTATNALAAHDPVGVSLFVANELEDLEVAGRRLGDDPDSAEFLQDLHREAVRNEAETTEVDQRRRDAAARKAEDALQQAAAKAFRSAPNDVEGRVAALGAVNELLEDPTMADHQDLVVDARSFVNALTSTDPADARLSAELEAALALATGTDAVATVRHRFEEALRSGDARGSWIATFGDNLRKRERENAMELFAGKDVTSALSRSDGADGNLNVFVANEQHAALQRSDQEYLDQLSSLAAAGTVPPQERVRLGREKMERDQAIRTEFITRENEARTQLADAVRRLDDASAVAQLGEGSVLSPDMVEAYVRAAERNELELERLSDPSGAAGIIISGALSTLDSALRSEDFSGDRETLQSAIDSLPSQFVAAVRQRVIEGGSGRLRSRGRDAIEIATELADKATKGLESPELANARLVYGQEFGDGELEDIVGWAKDASMAAAKQITEGTLTADRSLQYKGDPVRRRPEVSTDEWRKEVSEHQARLYEGRDDLKTFDWKMAVGLDSRIIKEAPSTAALGQMYVTGIGPRGIRWNDLMSGSAAVTVPRHFPPRIFGVIRGTIVPAHKLAIKFDPRDFDLYGTRIADSHEAVTALFKDEAFLAQLKDTFQIAHPAALKGLQESQHDLVDMAMDRGWVKETDPARVLEPRGESGGPAPERPREMLDFGRPRGVWPIENQRDRERSARFLGITPDELIRPRTELIKPALGPEATINTIKTGER